MISIIVPVFKVEKWIHRCIKSILNQSYTDWELLLIDDGSPDNSGAICDKYATKDTRIKVYHKNNGGVSSARNFGLDNAKGDWVVFIDGDDTITKDHLKLIAENPEHDLIVFGMATDRYTPKGKLYYTSSVFIPDKYIQEFSKLKEDYSLINKSLNMESSCCKGFRRNIIEKNSIRFNNEMICFEDFDFVLRYMKCCNGTFCSLPYIAYHYIQELSYNPIIRRNNKDLSHSVFILLNHLTDWISPEELNEIDKDTYIYILADKIRLILNQLKDMNFRDAKKIFCSIKDNKLYNIYRLKILSSISGYIRIVLNLNDLGLIRLAYFINTKR